MPPKAALKKTSAKKIPAKKIPVKKPSAKNKKTPSKKCGIIKGLYASTPGMGGITIIECSKIPSESKMRLELTGQEGDLMKESMSVAKTVAYNILPKEVKKKIHKEWGDDWSYGYHIHYPEGVTPKDGPSAGAALAIAIYSTMTKKKIRQDIAITGEIDTKGDIQAIGGLNSKVNDAKSAGFSMVLCPTENKNDVNKILSDNKDENFTIKMISNIKEAISILVVDDDKKEPSVLSKPRKISKELCNFLNINYSTLLSRVDASKLLRKYIADNNLQDKNNRRKIIPDKKIIELFSLGSDDELTILNLDNLIGKHFL